MKDFTSIKAIIEKDGEIRTKDLKELGYSNYDINQFMDSNLLIRTGRGVYALPSINQNLKQEQAIVKEPELESKENEIGKVTIVSEEIENLCKLGTYNLAKRNYTIAEEMFLSVLAIDENHTYANKVLAMISALKDDFEKSYEYLMRSYESLEVDTYIANYYLLFLMLSNVIYVPEEVLKEIKTKTYNYFNNNETNYRKYFSKILSSLKNGNFKRTGTVIYYLIQNDYKKRKYNFDNNFMELLLNKIINKLSISQNETPVIESSEIVTREEAVIVIPSIDETQILNNTLILNYINEEDYESARNLLKENSISNKDEVIEILLSKLIALKDVIFPSFPQKVKSAEPVQVVTESSIEKEVKANTSQSNSPSIPQVNASKITPLYKSKEEAVEESLEEKIDRQYSKYKEEFESFEFDEAKRSLTRYEMLIKQNGQYRNINYLYQRLENNKRDYEKNPEIYLQFNELKNQVTELIRNNKYEEAIVFASQMRELKLHNYQAEILLASIHNKMEDYEAAYEILLPLENVCEEPTYFNQMAKASYETRNYRKSLECCINFNERKPRSNVAIYVLMAKCYNRLRKYSKELKTLLIADELNKEKGKDIDLSHSIERATMASASNREYILAKINKKEIYVD